ncbi:Hypothetical_protein [Hexamita inflata]|uniref:Hypothetical_protein n=1 Tax=Hexamita inflata TaxID=28002 RepID=A0AA86Q9A7_9EUKA|nr:Hypothetical protein HINF_LOCUS36189 [Hexamita inflata]
MFERTFYLPPRKYSGTGKLCSTNFQLSRGSMVGRNQRIVFELPPEQSTWCIRCSSQFAFQMRQGCSRLICTELHVLLLGSKKGLSYGHGFTHYVPQLKARGGTQESTHLWLLLVSQMNCKSQAVVQLRIAGYAGKILQKGHEVLQSRVVASKYGYNAQSTSALFYSQGRHQYPNRRPLLRPRIFGTHYHKIHCKIQFYILGTNICTYYQPQMWLYYTRRIAKRQL